jgi:hypothetical protein
MAGIPGLDFDDIDDFAAATAVSSGQVVVAIERLIAPGPSSFVLEALGLVCAAAVPANRRRRVKGGFSSFGKGIG